MSTQHDGLSRREVMARGVAGAAGMMLAGQLGQFAHGATATPPQPPKLKPKAKSVIQIWMWGGPCHIDTFDPKPEAGSDYTGPLDKTVETNVKGIRIGELLPNLAKIADKYALIRSMAHGNNGHETASYLVQTGRPSGDGLVYPSMGAVVSLFKGYDAGYKGLLPPYIVLTELQGRFSEVGFLPSKCKPFATGGDPGAQRFNVEGVVAPGITEERQHNRRDLLQNLNTLDHAMKGDPRLAAMAQCEKEAYDLILGDGGRVFELSTEKNEVREKYGRNTFGQACLMARRLVEKGVPYITINYKGWDTHKQHFQIMRRKLPELDKGLSSLIAELSEHGLLDTTIVYCGGEFGRTPKVQWDPPWNGGRNHFGRVFSYLVAGGGFKGGQVVGSTDKRGEEAKDRPVHPSELMASMYELMGIDPEAKLPHPHKEIRALPSLTDSGAKVGRLREIM